jgi:hypothetical protein
LLAATPGIVEALAGLVAQCGANTV